MTGDDFSQLVAGWENAIAWDQQGQRCSYAGLRECVARSPICHALNAGDRVAFLPTNDSATLTAFWAIFASGATACPLSHRLPPAERQRIIDWLGAQWIETADLRAARTSVTAFADSSSAGTIMLTSGSSGRPKPVVHALRAHLANAEGAATNMPLTVGDRWLWSLPSFHVSGFSILIRCAAAGATVVIDQRPLSPFLLNELGITHLSVVPTQLYRLLASSAEARDRFPGRALQAVLLGGDAAPTQLIDEALSRGVPLHVTYGMTEMGSQISTTSRADSKRQILRSSGRVLPNRELRISAEAEIFVRGETLCLGYDEHGSVRPCVDAEGWLHTGDLGQLDEAGYLSVTGRRDNMFVSGGENVHPEVIEKVLLDFPRVRQAIVVPRYDSEFGQRPVAFVNADRWQPSHWASAAREYLPGFAIPVEFLPWPREIAGGIKPSRRRFARIANGNQTGDG